MPCRVVLCWVREEACVQEGAREIGSCESGKRLRLVGGRRGIVDVLGAVQHIGRHSLCVLRLLRAE